MREMLIDAGIILILLVVNGVFAMTEIAVVSARKGRLRRLAAEGDARATVALELAESPNRFLSTVQIGITLVGILAGAFGGATIAEKIANALQSFPVLAVYAEGIGLTIVVVIITFLSLVLGELVPKRIGLGNPEGIAIVMARPMHRLSVIAGPVVRVLSISTEALLRMLGRNPAEVATITEDEIKLRVQDELSAEVFQQVESKMVESVLRLDTLPVRDFMTPRAKIIWLDQHDPLDTVWHKIVGSHHTHFPVRAGHRDHVAGIVSMKAIYADVAADSPTRIADLMTQPLVVPVTQTAIELLNAYKESAKHIALVADESGGIVGLVTVHDIMQAIVGDLPSLEERVKPAATKRDDGCWLIDGMIDIAHVEKILPGLRLSDDERKDYETLAGFIVTHLGRVAKEGEIFEAHGYIFEILDMDRHRVDKVLVKPARDGRDDHGNSGAR